MIIILIFLTGILAAFVGAMVGGGGLISTSVLMLLGIPPQSAIASNRVGSFGLSFSAIGKYWKENKINWKWAILFSIVSMPGTYIGTQILIQIDKILLSRLAGIVVIIMLPLILLNKKITDTKLSKTHTIWGSVIYFFISIYSGIFGAGAAIMARYNLMMVMKMKAIESNATDLVVGFTTSIYALYLLLNTGFIIWKFGIAIFLGMLIGGWFGAHTAIKKGDEWVRIIFIIMTLVMGLKLILYP